MNNKLKIWREDGLNPDDYSNAVGRVMEDYANVKSLKLLLACENFVNKVECGKARSKQSYKEMKDAIKTFYEVELDY